ncbi:MAG: transporter substrate-binding domain-containing protein [Bermanella sp.]
MIIIRFWHQLIFLLVFSVGVTETSRALGSEDVRICYHEGEWLPYIYFKREGGKIDKSVVVGATVELFNEVFKRIGLGHSLTMGPWIRCLYEVTHFDKYKKFEVFTNGSYNEDRAEKYYITAALYKTHQGLFYSTKKFKTPPEIDSPADLKNYDICGILGYNYTMYKKLGVTNNIDTAAQGIAHVLKKIAGQKCDFFLSPMEPVLAGKKYGLYDYSGEIAVIKLPWAGTTTFHAFISKASPRAFELYTKINHEIQILQGSGESDRIFKKWLEEGDGL